MVLLYNNHYYVTMGSIVFGPRVRRCTSAALNDCQGIKIDALRSAFGVIHVDSHFYFAGSTGFGAGDSNVVRCNEAFSQCDVHHIGNLEPRGFVHHGKHLFVTSARDKNGALCTLPSLSQCDEVVGANTRAVAFDGKHWVFGHRDNADRKSIYFCTRPEISPQHCVQQHIPVGNLFYLDGISYDGTRWYISVGLYVNFAIEPVVIICSGGINGFTNCHQRQFPFTYQNPLGIGPVYIDGRGNYYVATYISSSMAYCTDALMTKCTIIDQI